jgi:RND superfamily putative drug exporter
MIDVVIVRMGLVPAAMTLAGSWNWYFPAWLDRILPKLEIEGESAHHLDPDAGIRPGAQVLSPAD